MLFVLSSKRTDLEALLCCVAAVKTGQPVGVTSQVTSFCPAHLCSAPWLAEAMTGTPQEPLQNWAAGVTVYRLLSPCSGQTKEHSNSWAALALPLYQGHCLEGSERPKMVIICLVVSVQVLCVFMSTRIVQNILGFFFFFFKEN